LQQQLATLQAAHKEVLHLLKEQEEQVGRLKKELQDGREQAVAAQDLVKGLQLENARYGCQREREHRVGCLLSVVVVERECRVE